jgi:hypothetical protein
VSMLRAAALLLPLFILGCGAEPSEDSDPVEGDTDTDADTDADTDTDVQAGMRGRVQILERWDQLEESHSGVVSAWGPLDAAWEEGVMGEWVISCDEQSGDTGVWRVVASAGDCELAVLQHCSGACDPDCDFGDYCVDEQRCVAAPDPADAGVITIDGLAVPVELIFTGHGYAASSLPGELFDEGDLVTVEAAGAAVPGFSGQLSGVAPLAASLPCEDIPARGEALTITWTPATSAGARVRFDMIQDVHLFQGPRVRCETEDDGELTVPVELMTAYLYGQKHGFTLTRYGQATADLGGGSWLALELGSAVGCVINPEHTPW